MSKYICLCGMEFENIRETEIHLKIWRQIDDSCHAILSRNWKLRAINLFKDLPVKKLTRIVGFSLVYMTIINHFDIKLNATECIAIGLGIGLCL